MYLQPTSPGITREAAHYLPFGIAQRHEQFAWCQASGMSGVEVDQPLDNYIGIAIVGIRLDLDRGCAFVVQYANVMDGNIFHFWILSKVEVRRQGKVYVRSMPRGIISD
ncbi:hypothetical protein NC77_26420 [Janthinobacterium lividum]|nr:hypothetical protein NC77_26420 [Janthinobacterium lividum]